MALVCGGQALPRLRLGWRDWLLPSALMLGVGSPWFIYQSLHAGFAFWNVLIGEHVITRFTSALDPSHLHPWDYYFSETWRETTITGSRIVVSLGVLRLLLAAFRGESWLSRLIVVWGVLPLVAISLGTSKLGHYAFPFWPPIALGAGFAGASLLGAADGPWGRLLSGVRIVPARLTGRINGSAGVRRVVAACTLIAAAVGLWTLIVGTVNVEIGGLRILRNGSIIRPTLIVLLDSHLQHVQGRMHFLPDRRVQLQIAPTTLLAAMWLQLAMAVSGNKDFLKCKFCEREIEISTASSGFRTNREFCSQSCKTKEYRRRKRKAIKFARQGKAVNSIARLTDTRPETVRGWVATLGTGVPKPRKGKE